MRRRTSIHDTCFKAGMKRCMRRGSRNTHVHAFWEGKMFRANIAFLHKIEGFIDKWVGRDYDEFYHAFCSVPEFRDSLRWRIYGRTCNPREYMKKMFRVGRWEVVDNRIRIRQSHLPDDVHAEFGADI